MTLAVVSASAIADISPQELEQLWLAIDSSSSSSSDFATAPNSNSNDTPSTGSAVVASEDGALRASGRSFGIQEEPSPATVTPTARASKRSARVMTPVRLEERRRRNREYMRRTHQRKLVELHQLRQQIVVLEGTLQAMNVMNEQGVAALSRSTREAAAHYATTESAQVPPRTEQDVQELLQLIKTYQHEQLCLHNAIQHHEKLAAALSQTIAESKSLNFANTSIYSGMRQRDESFLWVNSVLPFLPVFSKSQVSDLVRESYLDIVRHLVAADTVSASGDHALGWSAKRAVEDCWVDFAFSKTFPHEDIEVVATRTWEHFISTDPILKPKEAAFKVIERLNDDTVVMAKNLRSDSEHRCYHTLIVMIRVRTADGYVIGTRTISPLPQYERRFADALGLNRAFSRQFYGVVLSRLRASSSRGLNAKKGGRIGNGSPVLTKFLARNAVLSVLNWENHCTKPFQYLRVDW